LTDAVLTDFFWLSAVKPQKGQRIDAKIQDNLVTVRAHNVERVICTSTAAWSISPNP